MPGNNSPRKLGTGLVQQSGSLENISFPLELVRVAIGSGLPIVRSAGTSLYSAVNVRDTARLDSMFAVFVVLLERVLK